MNDFEHRLSEHFADRANNVDIDPGIGIVMAKGRRIRQRRAIGIGTAGVLAVTALIGGSLTMLQRPKATLVASQNSEAPSQNPVDADPQVDSTDSSNDVADAVLGDTGIIWTSEQSTAAMVSTDLGWGVTGSGGNVYALGTAPVPKGAPAQSQLYRTADGLSFDAVGPSFDPWITSLDDDGSRVYALGTAPLADDPTAYSYQVATSTDGIEFDSVPLPIDIPTIRAESGSAGAVGSQVVVGDGSVLATVNMIAFGDPSAALPDDVDATFGSVASADGIDVYGPPTDLDAIAAELCPPGWPLAEGSPRVPEAQPEGAVAATVFLGGGGSAEGQWHCASPDGNSDVWVDPAQVHGPVARSVGFAELDISSDSVKALRGEPRLFRSTDGNEWAEVSLPRSIDLRNSSTPQLLWLGDRYVFIAALQSEGTVLFTSPDGVSWSEGVGPERMTSPTFAALPDGTLLAVAQLDGKVAIAHSTDDVTWTYRSLDPLLSLDSTWRASVARVVAGPVGVAIVATAFRDVVAVSGGLNVEHSNFTLRYPDSQGTLQLLDSNGTVLETRQSWGPWTMPGGWIEFSNGGAGVTIVDPTSGEAVDYFRQAEIDSMWNSFYQDPDNQDLVNTQQPTASWVLDTTDAMTWAATPLSQLGLGGNLYPNSVIATAQSIQFGFQLFSNDGSGTSTTAMLIGKRR